MKKPVVLVGSLLVLIAISVLTIKSNVSAVSDTYVLNFRPVADTYVDSRYPTRNFGIASVLKLDQAPAEESYLKFQITGVSGDVISAKLRVYTTNPSVAGGSIAKISNTGWSESAVTYDNRPVIDGQVLSTLGKVSYQNWYEFDVTNAVVGDGTLSFGLKSSNSDGVDYASREDTAHAPQLIVTVSSSPSLFLIAVPPSPTPTLAPTSTPFLSPTPTQSEPIPCSMPTSTILTSVNSLRPYASTSPWNTPIGPNAVYDPYSQQRVARISGYFASDPNAWTFPIYQVTNAIPLRTVTLSGTFTSAVNNDSQVIRQSRGSVSVPIPAGAQPSTGSDGHLLVWNTETGDEWGFWQFKTNADGSLAATNGYHYNTNWDGVPPAGIFLSRGSGIPNLAGIIRPWEIAQGHIDHALAFAYPSPTSQFIYPAINSDGSSTNFYDMPEGTRLQLDPTLTEADFDTWGLSPAGKIIARAMQQYGLIITDRSGTPQLFLEDSHTANWSGAVANGTVSKIPFSRLKVI